MTTQQKPKRRRKLNLKKKDETRRVMPLHRPNAGIRAQYEKKLRRLLSELTKRLPEIVERLYESRMTEHRLLRDGREAVKAADAKRKDGGKTLEEQQREWREKYMADTYWMDDGWYEREAEKIAEWFGMEVGKDATRQWNKGVREIGFPEFEVTMIDAQKELVADAVRENVLLISKMRDEYRTRIDRMVNASIDNGTDLQSLTAGIRSIKGMTDRRAALIARDQVNKATSALHIANSRAAGATKGIWVHSFARKHPRKSHEVAGLTKLEFDLKKGAYLKDDSTGMSRYQFPGQEINCGCTFRTVFTIGGQGFR